jgi:hypothetical protein
MATLSIFNKARENILTGVFRFEGATAADTYNVMLVQASPTNVPIDTLSDPRYAASGAQDYSAPGNEADPNASGTYTASGSSIGLVDISPTDGSSSTITVDTADNTTAWTVDANNPTNAAYALIYNDTNAAKEAIGWFSLGQTFDMTAGTLTLDWDDTNGLFQLTP